MGQINDDRKKFLIEEIITNEELQDFYGPQQINDLEHRLLNPRPTPEPPEE